MTSPAARTGTGAGKMLDDVLAFLHAWWTANPVSWDSEFFSMPPVHADLRPVQAGGPPIWIGGASEAAMRRVGRSGTGWLAFEGLPDEIAGNLWSIARRTAEDAGSDPDALKKAMRINLESGMSVDSLAGELSGATPSPVWMRRSWMPSRCSPALTRCSTLPAS